jgi:hypothetical protein
VTDNPRPCPASVSLTLVLTLLVWVLFGQAQNAAGGCEQLLTQRFGFGSETHDDAVDALVYLILGVAGDGIEQKVIHYV